MEETPRRAAPGPATGDPVSISSIQDRIHKNLSTRVTVRSAAPRFLSSTR